MQKLQNELGRPPEDDEVAGEMGVSMDELFNTINETKSMPILSLEDLGILKEYYGKKIGRYLLSEAIKKSFENGSKRVWVHTCSLDHKHALNNYLSRGMKVFQTETINI